MTYEVRQRCASDYEPPTGLRRTDREIKRDCCLMFMEIIAARQGRDCDMYREFEAKAARWDASIRELEDKKSDV